VNRLSQPPRTARIFDAGDRHVTGRESAKDSVESQRGSAQRTVLIVVAALALLVLGVAFFLRGGETKPPAAITNAGVGALASNATDLAANTADTPLATSDELAARHSGTVAGVRLSGPGKLDGRVLERATSNGIGGVRVDLLPVPPAGAAFLGRMLRMSGMGDEMSQRILPVAVALTSADGSFHFQGVRQGTYYLDARGEYHVPDSVVRARVLASGAGGPIDVFVNAGGRVVGRVLTPDGKPAIAAKLVLVPGPSNFLTTARSGDLRWLETLSAKDGTFQIGGVPPGSGFEITCSGAGFALSHALDIEVKAGQDTQVVVQTRIGGVVVGRVMSNVEGKDPVPLAEAHLGAVPRGLRNLRCVEDVLEATHCTTAADGSYVMRNVPPGEVDLIAIAWEHLPAVGARAALADGAQIQATDIVLSKGPMVKGRVVDTQGNPVPGVQTRWNLVNWKNFQFDFSFAPLMMAAVKGLDLPKTDADGRFFAGAIAGEPDYSIDFTKAGFVDQEFKWNPARDGAEITVVMRRGSAVEGVVMDAEKAEPVTSFTITGGDRVDTEPDAPGSKNPFSGGLLIEDKGGRFKLDSVKPGMASLTFSAPGFLTKTIENIEVKEGESTRGVIVNLTPGGIVRGRVLDAAGNGVAGAQVLATSGRGGAMDVEEERQRARERRNRRGNGPPRGMFGGGGMGGGSGADMLPPGMMAYAASMGLLGDKTVLTNKEGAFEITGVAPGTFKVLAFHRDHTSAASTDLTMPETGALEGVVVTLPKGGGVQGIVHDRRGAPVGDELVIAFSPAAFDPNSASASGGLYQGHSNKDGQYDIQHVAPGSYFLVATRGDEELNPMSFMGTMNFDLVTVPPDETVKFDLVDSSAGACKVFGVVTYKGEPVSRGNLSAISYDTDNLLGVEFKAAKMMDGGRYEFAGLAPGEYQLNLDGSGPQVRMTLDVPDQPELRVDLALPEGGLEGKVVDDATNQPISGCEVVIRSTEKMEGQGLLGSFLSREGRASRDTSDDKGLFSFERLAGGEYEVTVRGPKRGDTKGKYAPADAVRVKIDDNRTEHGFVVRLQSSLALKGQIVDARKQPIAGATVLVSLQKGGYDLLERAKSDAAGHFEVNGLSPGTYKATATIDGYADGTTNNIKIERNGKLVETEVVMQKGALVSVRIYQSNGAPASGARAELKALKGENTTDPANAGKALQGLFTGEGAADANGRIDLGRYLPGEYRLDAQRGFSKATNPKVVIPAGQDEVELRIDLP
jgi:hypothetical protein